MRPNILITGATGNTGLPVVEELNSRKVSVRALVHSPSKVSLVDRPGVEIAIGDLDDRPSIERALAGIEKVYLLSPPSPDQFDRQAAFVDAAKDAGVKHIVKLSALGTAADSPVGLLRAHARIEEHILGSGMDHTFLRPHFFLENLLGSAGSVRKDGAIYSPLGDARISPVSVRDIAAVVVSVLTEPGHTGRTYTLTGPEAVDYRTIAGHLSAELGVPVAYVPVPFEAARAAMGK